jgi:hypothetical protein
MPSALDHFHEHADDMGGVKIAMDQRPVLSELVGAYKHPHEIATRLAGSWRYS